jgi:ABC-type Fe3+-hydroxamate transport system substrate-binding protein
MKSLAKTIIVFLLFNNRLMQYIDQLQRIVELELKPKRIVSLVPSQSEYLWDLGLQQELVGITKFCIHPEQMFRTVTRVGGTKQLDLQKIRDLKPDLIIGNKEENTKEDIAALEKEFPVWMSDVNTLEDALDMMRSLGQICGKENQAELLLEEAKQSLKLCKDLFKGNTALYFMWYDPWMCVAKGTYIQDVLRHLGFENLLLDHSRYPVFDPSLHMHLNPSVCLLSSEPFPFAQKHADELQAHFPNTKIMFVDGESFSWYGSRLGRVGKEMAALRELF